MRFSPASIAISLVMAALSSQVISKTESVRINSLSTAWVEQGIAAQTAGDSGSANDAYETALAVDPRNRFAYIALGQLARAEGLSGKAIRFYRQALILDPADTHALAGQGEAMVHKGAIAKARENLAKVQQLCSEHGCIEAQNLAATISRHDTTAVLDKEENANNTDLTVT